MVDGYYQLFAESYHGGQDLSVWTSFLHFLVRPSFSPTPPLEEECSWDVFPAIAKLQGRRQQQKKCLLNARYQSMQYLFNLA